MDPRVKEGPIFGSMPGFEPKLLRQVAGSTIGTEAGSTKGTESWKYDRDRKLDVG